jgi:acyl-CoA synthetase (NDP forming)
VGPDGLALEQEVCRRAAAGGVRLLGPNCQGILSLPDHLVANFSPSFASAREPGPVSMVSQSGGYNSIAFRLGGLNGVRFSRIVSTGNESDITATDLFEFLVDDDETSVVAAYLEQIRDARRFLEVMSRLTAEKPVVISKAGRSDVGSRAAASHTGALAGSGAVGRGVLLQAGVLPARSVDEFIALLTAFSGPQRLARGNRVGLLSQGGGFSVETTDLCRESGLALPPLEPRTVKALGQMIPYYGTSDNPVDFTAALMGNPAWLAETVELLADDEAIDIVTLLLTASPGAAAVDDLAAAVHASAKPVVVGWLGGIGDPDRDHLHSLGVPTFPTTLGLVTGLRGLASRGRRLLGHEFVGDLRPPRELR